MIFSQSSLSRRLFSAWITQVNHSGLIIWENRIQTNETKKVNKKIAHNKLKEIDIDDVDVADYLITNDNIDDGSHWPFFTQHTTFNIFPQRLYSLSLFDFVFFIRIEKEIQGRPMDKQRKREEMNWTVRTGRKSSTNLGTRNI